MCMYIKTPQPYLNWLHGVREEKQMPKSLVNLNPTVSIVFDISLCVF